MNLLVFLIIQNVLWCCFSLLIPGIKAKKIVFGIRRLENSIYLTPVKIRDFIVYLYLCYSKTFFSMLYFNFICKSQKNETLFSVRFSRWSWVSTLPTFARWFADNRNQYVSKWRSQNPIIFIQPYPSSPFPSWMWWSVWNDNLLKQGCQTLVQGRPDFFVRGPNFFSFLSTFWNFKCFFYLNYIIFVL